MVEEFEQKMLAYNLELNTLIENIDYSHESLAFTRLPHLALAQTELNRAMEMALYPILAAVPVLKDSLTNFSDMYFGQLGNPISNCNDLRIDLNFHLLALMLDSSDYTTNEYIVNIGKRIQSLNNSILIALKQFNNLVDGIPVPAYPELIEIEYDAVMSPHSQQEVQMSFKNYGNTVMEDAYILVSTDRGFKVGLDSINIWTF
jgi:hypothetical protein